MSENEAKPTGALIRLVRLLQQLWAELDARLQRIEARLDELESDRE